MLRDTTRFLVKAETHNGTDWQNQAEMKYDGLGNRLEMTGFAEGQSVTTRYALDNGQVLLAAAGEQITAYLYGNGVIGELTDAWAYSLLDGANTPRQMTDASGSVTLATSYTPWGDTLSVQGTGNFSFGYFGGVMDTAIGLLYIGGGQYYDPETGRFISRNAKPGQVNPYVPWQADPSAALISPLLVLALVYGRKKKRSKLDNLLILLVLSAAVGMSVSACGTVTPTGQVPTGSLKATVEITTPTPTKTGESGGTTDNGTTPPAAGAPTKDSVIIKCTATVTPIPTPTPDKPTKPVNLQLRKEEVWTTYEKLWESLVCLSNGIIIMNFRHGIGSG